LFREALQMLSSRDREILTNAIADLTEATGANPGDSRAYVNRALAYFHRGRGEAPGCHNQQDIEQAEIDCNEAIRLDPGSSDGYAVRAATYTVQHGHRGDSLTTLRSYPRCAIIDCDVALRLDPTNSFAYAIRGAAHIRERNCDQAIADCGAALHGGLRWSLGGPNRFTSFAILVHNLFWELVYTERAAAFLEKEEMQRALTDCTEALRHKSDSARIYSIRAAVYGCMGDCDRELEAQNEVVRLWPTASSYGTRGYAYVRKGDLDRAIGDFTRALDLEPGNGFSYTGRGSAYRRKGDFARAVDDLRKAVAASRGWDEWPLKELALAEQYSTALE
jgi:tetratricopeptide (TPR) repeat protein